MINYIDEIRDVLKSPLKIIEYSYDKDIRYYYKYYKNRKSNAKYLLVIVKYLNGKGYVVSAYFVKNIK